MGELRRYGVLLAAGAAGSTPIVLDLRKAADGRLAGSADWTPVPGDTTVSIDEGTGANITTVPAFAGGRWRLVLTAAELTGKSIVVRVVDQDGPVIQDTLVEVQTFGSAAAYYPDNYSAQLLPSALVGGRVDANMGAISTDAAAADNLETMLDGTGGSVLSLKQLNIVNSTGDALSAVSTGGNGRGIYAAGAGIGPGLEGEGGGTGGAGMSLSGYGFQSALSASAFGTGHGISALGGLTSGDGIHAEAQAEGDGMELVPAGSGLPLNPAVSGGGTGGSSQTGFWDYNTTTTMADPGAGRVRFNGSLAAATQIAFDDLTSGGTDASAVLQELLPGDSIYVQDQANSAIATRYTLTAGPVHQTGFWLLAVSVVSSAGLPANNASLLVNFRTAGATAAEIADTVFAYLVETGLTFKHFCQAMEAMLAGKVNGAGTGTENFRDHADTKNRVTMTTDSSGNRTAVARIYD